jgi:hypothetical protein
MKNRPLILTLVCLGLAALVWYDNQPAQKPDHRATVPAASGKPDKAATGVAERAAGAEKAWSANDEKEQGQGHVDEQTARAGATGSEGAAPEAGASDASGPGASDAFGPGASDASGPGASDASGLGVSDASGPGVSDASGPGVSDAVEPGASAPAAETAAPQSGNPLASLDKSTLKDWVERPLFAPSRKRPPPAAAVQGQAPQVAGTKAPPPLYDLMGVVREQGRAIALLRKKSDGTSFRVQVGDTLGGWQVSKVDPRAVTLVRDDGTSETVSIFRE